MFNYIYIFGKKFPSHKYNMATFSINTPKKKLFIRSFVVYGLLILAFPLKVISQTATRLEKEIAPFQQLVFRGKVTDEYGKVMRDVNIHIPGTMRGTITDMNGDFTLDAKAKETVEVSYVGKLTQLIQLEEKDTIGLHWVLKTETRRLKDFTITKRQEVDFCPGEECFGVIERAASFPGGEDSLIAYLKQAVSYPESALKKGEEGQVIIGFTVDENGKISHPDVVKSVSPALDQEAMRVIMAMPIWLPALQRNRPIATRQELPINFVINLSPGKTVECW